MSNHESFTMLGKTYKTKYKSGDTVDYYNINDLDDLVDSLVYPNNLTVSYQYDELSRLQNLDSDLTGTVKYDYSTDTSGEKTVTTYPEGTSFIQNANSFGELTETNHSNGWTETNTYDGFGNITEILRNGQTWNYEYDNIDRFTKEANPNERPKSYQYDELGNRQKLEKGGSLLPDEDREFPLPTENREYVYDSLNRLTKATTGTKSATYTYYPGGLRASKTVDGKTTKYVYFNGNVIEEYDGSGRLKAQNVYGNKLVLRKDFASNLSGFYLYNSHGDVVKIVDKDYGSTLNEYAYDAWGNESKNDSAEQQMSNPFRYSGEIFDEETGFYYLRARYYDPTIGRFITEDTYKGQVDNPLSLNRYTYVSNNPLKYIDPTGHKEVIGGNSREIRIYDWARWVERVVETGEMTHQEAFSHVPADIERDVEFLVIMADDDLMAMGYGGGRGGGGGFNNAVKQAERQAIKPVVNNEIKSLGIIKTFDTSVIKKEHIFSKDHISRGIMQLGKTQDDIVNSFASITRTADAKGLLKEGSNQIFTEVNGFEAEIRVYIKDGKVLNLDGFKGYSTRIDKNNSIKFIP